jgi:bifunctional non-homologous end joining protein LigD
VTYFAFDLLGFEGHDLRGLPLVERKRLLAEVVPPHGPIRYADHVADRGLEFYEQVHALGLEGMLAKRGDSPYRSGRSTAWIKVRAERSGDFAVVGYTAPKGSRAGFGALHVAVHSGGRLVYAGRVGTGFNDKQLDALRAGLEPFARREPACDGAPKGGDEHVWVEPQMVIEAKFTEFTRDGHLRHPVFVRVPLHPFPGGVRGHSVAGHLAQIGIPPAVPHQLALGHDQQVHHDGGDHPDEEGAHGRTGARIW